MTGRVFSRERVHAPNQRARRLEPNRSFSAICAAEGTLNVPVFVGTGQEVDVDTADASLAELDVAGAPSKVAFRGLAAP